MNAEMERDILAIKLKHAEDVIDLAVRLMQRNGWESFCIAWAGIGWAAVAHRAVDDGWINAEWSTCTHCGERLEWDDALDGWDCSHGPNCIAGAVFAVAK